MQCRKKRGVALRRHYNSVSGGKFPRRKIWELKLLVNLRRVIDIDIIDHAAHRWP